MTKARRTLPRAIMASIAGIQIAAAAPAAAHPHVFVDGGVDFVFDDRDVLAALTVTWLFDEFQTLYTLSALGLGLNDEGALDEEDRHELVRRLDDWPEDFEGSTHLSIGDQKMKLARPAGLEASLMDGRLEMTFTRRLNSPVPLAGRAAEVAFYEATYFYAFSVTNKPQISDGAGRCTSRVIRFNPDTQFAALQTTLFELGREETPEVENVGALFADRIVVRCG